MAFTCFFSSRAWQTVLPGQRPPHALRRSTRLLKLLQVALPLDEARGAQLHIPGDSVHQPTCLHARGTRRGTQTHFQSFVLMLSFQPASQET